MFYIYVLRNASNNVNYIGSTNNLECRIKEHNEGKVFSTKKIKSWTLVYYEAYKLERYARLREKRLKQHGNAKRELLKRAGIKKNGAG